MTLTLLLAACLQTPEPFDTDSAVDDTSADDTSADDTAPVADSCTALATEGQLARRVNATSTDDWRHLDLNANALLTVAEPSTDEGWYLGLQRYALKLNGGVSGAGGMEAVFVEGETLEGLSAAPSSGWTTDAEDSDDDGVPEYALGGWYDYDETTHVLSPKAGVYVIRAPSGETWALRVEDYYDDAGSGGYPCLRWTALETP